MTNFINWLVASSSDPTKIALSIKGVALLFGGYVVHAVALSCAFGLYCIGIDSDLVNQIADVIYTVVYGLMLLIGAIVLGVGLIRKVYLGRWSHPNATVL